MKDYELPDGRFIKIHAPRFMAPEALFDPSLIKSGDKTPGMHQLCYNTIEECDLDVRPDLYGNIVLSGGNTLFEGLP